MNSMMILTLFCTMLTSWLRAQAYQICLTIFKVPSLTSTTKHPDLTVGMEYTEMNKEQKTALNIQDFSLGSEDELYTKNYNNDGNHGGDSASVARGYILHHPEPKEGVRQVESDERKALPTPGMATCKLQSSKTEWLVQRTATGQCHQITT